MELGSAVNYQHPLIVVARWEQVDTAQTTSHLRYVGELSNGSFDIESKTERFSLSVRNDMSAHASKELSERSVRRKR